MTQWRYHSLVIRDLSICESKLNAEGEKGWELINVCLIDHNTARCFFKMPVGEEGAQHSTAHFAAVNSHSP
jgi:hypothetical protein